MMGAILDIVVSQAQGWEEWRKKAMWASKDCSRHHRGTWRLREWEENNTIYVGLSRLL